MTNEELFSVAEIVERATKRFNEQAALHKVRCDQYDQLIADMKAEHETKMAEHRAAFGARTEADAKIIEGLRKERDGLLTQVQDMREEIIRVNDAHGRTIVERDALRAEVAALQERLRASIARGDFAQMKLAALKSQTPKHPVKVGEYVTWCGSPGVSGGTIKQVAEIRDDRAYRFTDGGVWSFALCEPCDPPLEATHDTPEGRSVAESAVKVDPKPGDTVRLVRVPTHTDIPAMLPWSNAFGIPGDTATVETMARPEKQPSGTIPVRTEMGRCFYWPLSCVEGVRAELDAIKVGDVVRATSWKAGKAALVKKILSDGRLMLDCSDQPWRVDEVVKLARKVTT